MISQRSLLGLCLAFLATASFSLMGCGGAECGEGTIEQDGECVLAEEVPQCEEGEVLKDGECVAEIECGVNTTLDEDGEQCIADDPVSCDEPNTELDPNDNTCYATEAVCGDNTAFSASEDRCVPTSEVCADGTHYDDASGLCFPSIECQSGDIVLDGVCASPAAALFADADVIADGNTNPDLDGTPAELTVAPIGEHTVFAGTINPPSDIDDDGELDQEIDFFSFDGEEGDWFEISIYSDGIPSASFVVFSAEENELFLERLSPVAVARDKSRQVVLPETGTYHIAVLPESLLTSNESLVGGDDWTYAGTLEQLDVPDAQQHDFSGGSLTGTLGNLTDHLYHIDGFEAGLPVSVSWDTAPTGADQVVTFWASPTEFISEESGDSATLTVPASGEFFMVLDWDLRWSNAGLDFEITAEENTDLEPGNSRTDTFTADDGDIVEIVAMYDNTSLGVDITVTAPNGDVVIDDERYDPYESLIFVADQDGDYTVTFENSWGFTTFEDFSYSIEILVPEFLETITVADSGAVIELEQVNVSDQNITFILTDEDGVEVFFAEIESDGIDRFVNAPAGDYDVEVLTAVDTNDITFTYDVVTPTVIDDLDATYSGTGFEGWMYQQEFFLLELTEDATVEITVTGTNFGGIAWGRLFVYEPLNDQTYRGGNITSSNNVYTHTINVDADTPYVIQVGGDSNTDNDSWFMDFDLTLEQL